MLRWPRDDRYMQSVFCLGSRNIGFLFGVRRSAVWLVLEYGFDFYMFVS